MVDDLKNIDRLVWWRPLQLFIVVLLIALVGEWLGWALLEKGTDQTTLLSTTACFYAIIFLCLLVFVRRERIGFRRLGFWRTVGWKKIILVATALGLAAQLVSFGLYELAGDITFDLGLFPASTFVFRLIVAAFLVALVEESVFRGYIQGTFTRGYGFIRALLFASLLFAVLHIPFYTIYKFADLGILESMGPLVTYRLISVALVIFPVGVFLGYFYHKSRQNLLFPITIHAAVNASGLFLLSYSNLQSIILTLDCKLVILLCMVWATITAALVWAVTRTMIFRSAVKLPRIKRMKEIPITGKMIAAGAFVVSITAVVIGCHVTELTGWEVYQNDEYNFSVSHPRNWEKIPISGCAVAFKGPLADGFVANFTVIVSSCDNMSLEEFVATHRENMEVAVPGIITSNERYIEVNDRIGYEWILKWRYSNFDLQQRQTIFVVRGKSYLLTLTALEKNYNSYADTFDTIVNSFTIE